MRKTFIAIPKFRVFLAVALLGLLGCGVALAQDNPFVGTWKLNVEKSKYVPGPPPKEQTRTWDAAGKVDVQGIGASGAPHQYGYTLLLDGKPAPTSGSLPNGADHVVSKRMNLRTVGATFFRQGKQVETTRFILSPDGKTMTLTAKGVLPNGNAFDTTALWERQ